MKFSIIIPVYNAEQYLKRCLDSVFEQTYKNFEIIAINDGSTDASLSILNSYKNRNNITIISQDNKGLSFSRNLGVKKSTGDYIIFLDSDDYIDKILLETLNDYIDDEDLIKFSYKEIKDKQETECETIEFKKLKGTDAFRELLNSKIMFEMACIYAYKTEYMLGFEFRVGKYHEDFGLIPIMINDATKVSSINFFGYFYNKDNDASITSFTDEKKEYQKALDTLYFFQNVKKNYTDKYLLSFYGNGVLWRIKNLQKDYKKKYIKVIKKEKIYKYILDDNIKRKIKKVLLKLYFVIHF